MDEEVVISPALPSRPLPQPSVASPPPAPSRPALPPIPPMGLAKAPPVPSAAAPPVPGAISTSASQSTAAAARRPSVSSTKSAGSAALPLPGLPPLPAQEGDGNSGKENDTVDEDANQDEETNDDGESVKARGVARLAKIVEDYEAAQPEELNLMSGDVVTIISRGTDDDPRWKGEYHGKKGYFPSHVVEAIEESADLDEEEAESSGARPKGFKLAAYGVQQGGLGSVFAGGGMPTLRRAAPPPRKTDDDEGGSAAAPVPVLAPVPAIPKLRSVQRPPAAKEEQVNFLAQLSRVPRKQTSSIPNDESIVSPEPAAAAPLPISRKPSFNVRTAAAAAEPGAATAAVPQEWQRQIEGEQSRLRSDVDAAKRAGSQVDQLASRLAASEHESQAHKQTISGLERQIESLAAQVAAMASSLTGIQRSVAGLEASKGVTAKEVSAIVQTELKAATQPLQHQSQELWSETKTLHTKISDLRAYVDELVVEEEN
ncbi:hypothetical protein EV174_003557 [Coemansia sp. RSA 2320]|nr:hypothetical protein EV174_003557 [Coemansia sp. RSA 2320]